VKRTLLLLLCFLMLCNLLLSAQAARGARTARSRAVHTNEKSSVRVPAQEVPQGLKKIYSNLGPKNDAYLDSDGWSITGFNSFGGDNYAFEIGLPFTPKSDSHVSQARAALQYDGLGANQVNVSIYSDVGGVPGSLLAGPVTVSNLPDFGTCCTLVVASFTPLAVSGGTQYWIVANTPVSGEGSDFVGVWDWNYQPLPFAGSNGVNGWFAEIGNTWPAGAVYGTVP